MTHATHPDVHIPGTYMFDGRAAMKGYALNKMCFSLNDASNRAALLADEDAYLERFHLTDEQRAAVLQAVMTRLNIDVPEQGPLPRRVRIMTMHGAKGLSGRVVFIPGLEEEISGYDGAKRTFATVKTPLRDASQGTPAAPWIKSS